MANAELGGGELGPWKLVNVLLHLFNGLLLTMLAMRLFSRSVSTPKAAWLGFAAGAIWMVHPLQVSTVLYTVQRMSELSALFVFGGLWAWCRGRDMLCGGGERRAGAWWLASALIIALPLAALSKENGLLLVFFLAALEWTVYADAERPRWLKWLVVGCVVLPLVLAAGYFATDLQGRFLNSYTVRAFTPLERLATQAIVLVDPFTEENGATALAPGSQKTLRYPDVNDDFFGNCIYRLVARNLDQRVRHFPF